MRLSNSINKRLLIALAATIGIAQVCVAQDKSQVSPSISSSCSRENALAIVEQQIDLSRTINDAVARVRVLIRAADLIWPYEEEKARASFSEAFDFAKRNFTRQADEPTREGMLLIGKNDQRYTVIAAITKRDAAWAKRLTDQMLKEEKEEAEQKTGQDAAYAIRTAERLLTTALTLLSSDKDAAMQFAQNSLRYPATMYLGQFLYQLAALNNASADQFYREALAAYAGAPMERFLYLSAYPFGNARDAGDMPSYMMYQVPAGFTPNTNLQRMFVQIILRRAQNLLTDSGETSSGVRVSDTDELWLALTRLEMQIQQSLPDLAAAVESVKRNLTAQLPPDSQRHLQRAVDNDHPVKHTFEEQVEAALKNPDVDRRDAQLVSAIIGSTDEAIDHVMDALDKISDSQLREPLLDWLYFDRAQKAIKDQRLDEARKMAAKVAELDQRAFLYSRIADESLKANGDQTQAREVLEDVVAVAGKAPNSVITARALLGVAYLYTKFDINRAVAVMGEAIKRINQIDHPDFSRPGVIRRIEGKTFGSYAGFATPGFNPENAFREIGKIDFDGMLNQASNIADKPLRAMCTLALVEVCLQQQPGTRKLVKPPTKP